MHTERSLLWVSFGGPLTETYRYRGKYLQPTIGLIMWFTVEELEDRLEERWLQEFHLLVKNNDVGQPDTPGHSGTKPSTKGYRWFQPRVAEECHVGHQWEEKSLVL